MTKNRINHAWHGLSEQELIYTLYSKLNITIYQNGKAKFVFTFKNP